VDRAGTGSLKWQRYEGRDILPLWVADMDFRSPPEVVDALRARLDHGVYGYTIPYPAVREEVLAYLSRRHGLSVDPDWLVWLPGLVQGLNLVCRAAGGAGDGVMVNTPVYPPFLSSPLFSDRERIVSELRWDGNRYTFDFEAMEAQVTPRTRLFILCNPHNPVGRVFDRTELEALLAFCERHDLWICADEIHCDLILDPVPHVPLLALGERAAARTIAFYSPSKTYNLPGLACAYAVIPNARIRQAFQKVCRGIITEVNCFGYAGCAAAYRHGEPWRQALLEVLRGNRDFLLAHLAERHPDLVCRPLQATYLAWIDLRALGLEQPAAHFEAHGIGLSNGVDFGAPAGFLRLNFGFPRAILEEGLRRFDAAVDSARVSPCRPPGP
jgi:cystathionine beta-lyase